MKRITVAIAGSTRPQQELTISPGTTSADILRQLGLTGYLLSIKGADSYLGDEENVYEQVSSGALLYATTPAEVGTLLKPVA
jgi:hypothetical protein